MTKNEKRNRYWSGPQSSLFEVRRLSDDRCKWDPSGGWCIVVLKVCWRCVSLQVGSCSSIFPMAPWCQDAQAEMCYWSASGNAFFLNYRQKTQWRRPCVAHHCRDCVGTGTLAEWMTGAPSQRRWNVVEGMLSQIVMTRRNFQALIKENNFHWLWDSLNHCACHPHGDLLLIKKKKIAQKMHIIVSNHITLYISIFVPLAVFRNDGPLFVLYMSSACDFLLIILALLWTSQSATLFSADITSLGVVTESSKLSLRGWRKENLVMWSLIFILPGVQSSNSIVKEAWLWTMAGVGVEGTRSGRIGVSFVGTSSTCGSGFLTSLGRASFVGISK